MTFPAPSLKLFPGEPIKKALQLSHKLAPFPIKKKLLETLLNNFLKQAIVDEDFYFLEERRLGLKITDLKLQLVLSLENDKLVLMQEAEAETWITGETEAFITLINRQQDPDTLFFQRRLLIEGDTELGLCVKNTLDGLDWDESGLTKNILSMMERFSPTS